MFSNTRWDGQTYRQMASAKLSSKPNILNPTTLSTIGSSIGASEKGDATHKALLSVRLDGSGFKITLNISVEGADPDPTQLINSSGQMVLGISSPNAVVRLG
jgi:hypothetical protein